MADIRIKDLPTTATQTSSDDFIALDGTTNGTRKLSAYNPSFGGAITGVSLTAPTTTNLTLAGGSTGASLVLGQGAGGAKIVGQSPSSPMTVNIGQTGAAGTSIEMVTSAGIGYIQHFNRTSVAYVPLEIAGEYVQTRTAAGVSTRLTSTGNLLIGTTTDISGSGNLAVAGGTVTAGAAATNLTLSGGSTGASLVLGQGANGAATLTAKLNGDINLNSSGSGFVKATSLIASYRDLTDTDQLVGHLAAVGLTNTNKATVIGYNTTSNYGFIYSGIVGSNWSPLSLQPRGGNLLIGTTTDSGNGKLQLATHTTSAGGIGFGPDTAMFRDTAGGLQQAYSAGTTTRYRLVNNTGNASVFSRTGTTTTISSDDGAVVLASNNTTALTLASNQAATFAGAVTVGTGTGATDATVTVNATATTQSANIKFQAAGVAKWAMGRGVATGNNNFSLYNENTGVQVITADTTTNAVNVISTTPSTGAGSGALQVAGGIYAGAASVFGANVNLSASSAITRALSVTNTLGNVDVGVFGSGGVGYVGTTSATNFQIYAHNALSATFGAGGAATFAGAVNMASTTSASSSTVGALTIGNGTAATNVAIGGGNIYSGGSVYNNGSGYFWDVSGVTRLRAYMATASSMRFFNGSVDSFIFDLANNNFSIAGTTPSTGAGSGALQVAGGIYSGANSYFTGQITSARPFMATGSIAANMTSAGGIGFAGGGANVFSFGANASTTGAFSVQLVSSDASLNFNALTIAANTGAATFSGGVTGSSFEFNATGAARLKPSDGYVYFQVGGSAYYSHYPNSVYSEIATNNATYKHIRFVPTSNGSVVVNNAAVATTATSGFLYVPTCAGAPTGVPASHTGTAPIVIDTTNNKLYFYSGGAWRDAGP